MQHEVVTNDRNRDGILVSRLRDQQDVCCAKGQVPVQKETEASL